MTVTKALRISYKVEHETMILRTFPCTLLGWAVITRGNICCTAKRFDRLANNKPYQCTGNSYMERQVTHSRTWGQFHGAASAKRFAQPKNVILSRKGYPAKMQCDAHSS